MENLCTEVVIQNKIHVRGLRRKEITNKMKNFTPSAIHRSMLAEEDPQKLQYGSEVPSKIVLKVIKSEAKNKLNLVAEITALKDRLENEDHQMHISP